MADMGLTRMRRLLKRAARDERGATAIEYAMIAVGISIAVAATVFATGSNLDKNFYQKVRDEVSK